MKKINILTIIFTIILCITPIIQSVPELPSTVRGTLHINGIPAPLGTVIEARAEGILPVGGGGNPHIVEEKGRYSLAISGVKPNTVVRFFILRDGTRFYAGQNYTFEGPGRFRNLNLTIVVPVPPVVVAPPVAPSPPADPGARPPAVVPPAVVPPAVVPPAVVPPAVVPPAVVPPAVVPPVINVPVDPITSAVISTTTLTVEKVTLMIPEGTIVRDAEGRLLTTSITTLHIPEIAERIGAIDAYDFGPDGTTFSPPIDLVIAYDPADLPAGYRELDLVIRMWDGTAWIDLATTIDTVANTATAKVSHFTIFALFVAPPVDPPVEEPAIILLLIGAVLAIIIGIIAAIVILKKKN